MVIADLLVPFPLLLLLTILFFRDAVHTVAKSHRDSAFTHTLHNR